MIWGLISLLLGLGATYAAILEVRDFRIGKGNFSNRHIAAFGSWKINRVLVVVNSWLNLVSMALGGPFMIWLGLWLMLKN